MRESNVRAHVRDAMRASRYTEHKLILQDFITTKSGQRLLESAANAAEMSVPTLQALIAQLPEMDFYAPFREHRVTWKASAAVVVGITLQDNALSAPAYTASGAKIEVLSFSAGNVALLLLQAAEPKSTYAASRGSGAPRR